MKKIIFIVSLIAVFIITAILLIPTKSNNYKTEHTLKVTKKNKGINRKLFCIDKFDKNQYDSIKKEYIHNYKQNDFLLYSLICANKWKSGEAAYDVFYTLSMLDETNRFSENINLDFLDLQTRKLAISHLIMAAKSGQANAKYTLGKYYLDGKYVQKNVLLGNNLIKEANKSSNGVFGD